ncbi:hypothetical protein LTR10_004551 [Elasticomyces elasticus]|nr:hypothetical protein LTR10_004551 [Elasticomyces elasticus]KAK4976871.1 hypothetical protein LTR42_002916 [Elasticomyces elasticus]
MLSTVSPNTDLASFHDHLKKSTRVLALLGAGLSASSGLPTFRGKGGLWRTHDAMSLATPEAFDDDPALVWQFYGHRRHMSLNAQPNPAHYALARLAEKMPGFQALSQNVDGLSPRANHPPGQLQLLHGSLFDVKCVDQTKCGYIEINYEDPVVPALAMPTGVDPTSDEARDAAIKSHDISDINTALPKVEIKDLPFCPKCSQHLLRPGVVWFGEALPTKVLDNVDAYMRGGKIDLIMVIGTGAKVYPASSFIGDARQLGAKVCVVNMDANDRPPGGWQEGDWFFEGDAAELLPKMLEPVIGKRY